MRLIHESLRYLQALKEESVKLDLRTLHYWTVREAGEEILGFRRRKKEDWIQQGRKEGSQAGRQAGTQEGRKEARKEGRIFEATEDMAINTEPQSIQEIKHLECSTSALNYARGHVRTMRMTKMAEFCKIAAILQMIG